MLDQLAPEWVTSQWFNSPPLTLADLRGRIVVLGTMQRYNLRGTPSLVLIDRQGRLRHSSFGHEPDLALGARIAMLLAEGAEVVASSDGQQPYGETCRAGGDCS